MPSPHKTAQRFVDAVYRRLILIHTLEQLGRGFLVSSALAAFLIAIAIWQSMPTAPILLFCSGLGLTLGIVLAILRRPSRWSAAAEADRQLRLDDLLTTALFSMDVSEDFIQTVRAMADARSAQHAPSEVLLRQLGLRSWGAVGVAMSLAVVLAVIPLRPASSQAVDASDSILQASPFGPSASEANQTRASEQNDNPINSSQTPSSDSPANGSMPAPQSTASPAADNDHGNLMAHSQNEGGLAVSADSGHSSTSGHDQKLLHTNASGSLQRQNSNGVVAGGGNESTDGKGSPASGNSLVAGQPPASPTPQWQGDGADQRSGAPEKTSQFPAEDRDLIRQFFQK